MGIEETGPRRPLFLQKEILRLEQEIDELVMEKLNGDGGSSAHEIGT